MAESEREYLNPTNEFEAARMMVRAMNLPVCAAVEFARAAGDLLGTTERERKIAKIWNRRLTRFLAAAEAMRDERCQQEPGK